MESKKIKMLTPGPNKNYVPGSIVFVDRARAAALIANGDAEYIMDEVAKGGEPDGSRINNPPSKRAFEPGPRKKLSKN